MDDRRCEFEADGLIEVRGICRISDPEHPIVGAAVYEHASANEARRCFADAV